MNELEIIGDPPIPEIEVQEIYILICNQEKYKCNLITTLNLVDDREMRQLNRKYRGKDTPTDVLSFSDESMAGMGGTDRVNDSSVGSPLQMNDIIIDIKQLERQKGQNTLDDEFRRVFIHGMLHVLGYDHIRKSDALNMEEKEDHYFNMIQSEK